MVAILTRIFMIAVLTPTLFPNFRLFMVVMMTIIFVMVVLYAKLFLVARKHAHAIAAMTVTGEVISRGHVKKTSDHAWRYTKTVLLIVGVNYAAWLPMSEFRPWSNIGHHCKKLFNTIICCRNRPTLTS